MLKTKKVIVLDRWIDTKNGISYEYIRTKKSFYVRLENSNSSFRYIASVREICNKDIFDTNVKKYFSPKYFIKKLQKT